MKSYFLIPKNPDHSGFYWEIQGNKAFYYGNQMKNYPLSFSGTLTRETKRGWLITTYSLNIRAIEIHIDRGTFEVREERPV